MRLHVRKGERGRYYLPSVGQISYSYLPASPSSRNKRCRGRRPPSCVGARSRCAPGIHLERRCCVDWTDERLNTVSKLPLTFGGSIALPIGVALLLWPDRLSYPPLDIVQLILVALARHSSVPIDVDLLFIVRILIVIHGRIFKDLGEVPFPSMWPRSELVKRVLAWRRRAVPTYNANRVRSRS